MNTILKTNSDRADTVLARVEIGHGTWTSYGYDGRMTTEACDWPSAARDGKGFRARFRDNACGGDYAWGPLGRTKIEAVALLLAEYAGVFMEDRT
jgi:hypothetical protein